MRTLINSEKLEKKVRSLVCASHRRPYPVLWRVSGSRLAEALGNTYQCPKCKAKFFVPSQEFQEETK